MNLIIGISKTHVKKWLSSTSRGHPIQLSWFGCLTLSQVCTLSSYYLIIGPYTLNQDENSKISKYVMF